MPRALFFRNSNIICVPMSHAELAESVAYWAQALQIVSANLLAQIIKGGPFADLTGCCTKTTAICIAKHASKVKWVNKYYLHCLLATIRLAIVCSFVQVGQKLLCDKENAKAFFYMERESPSPFKSFSIKVWIFHGMAKYGLFLLAYLYFVRVLRISKQSFLA